MRLRRVADQEVDLGGPEETLVDHHVLLPVEVDCAEGQLHQLLDRVGLPRRYHVVVGAVLLEHHPHGADVVGRVPPVALRVEVAERQFVAQSRLDAGDAVGDLAGDELQPATRGLMVEQDARRGVEVVALAVVDGDPVAVDLRHPVGTARIEGGALRLGHLLHLAEHLRGAGLVEADLRIDRPDRVEHSGHAQRGGLTGQHRLAPRGLHEGLGGQVVDLGGSVVAAGCGSSRPRRGGLRPRE